MDLRAILEDVTNDCKNYEKAQYLNSLEENLELYPEFLDIAANPAENLRIRQNASFSFKRMTLKHRTEILKAPFVEEIKTKILGLLPEVNDTAIRDTIIAMMNELAMTRDTPWPEAIDFAFQFGSIHEYKNLHISLNVLSSIMLSIDNTFVEGEMLEPMSVMMSAALESGNEGLIKDAANLFVNIVGVIEMALPEILQPIYEKILELFNVALKNPKGNLANDLGSALERSMVQSGVIHPVFFCQALIDMANDEEVAARNSIVPIGPLGAAAVNFPNDTKELLPQFIQTAFVCTQRGFISEAATSDQVSIEGFFEILFECFSATTIMQIATEIIQNVEDQGAQYASFEFFYALVNKMPDTAMSSSTLIVTQCLSACGEETPLCTRLLSISVLDSMINTCGHSIDDFAESVVEAAVSLAGSASGGDAMERDLASPVALLLDSALSLLKIEPEWLESIWEAIQALASVEHATADALDALASFIEVGGAGIAGILGDILAIVQEAIGMETENTAIRANGVICLGYILALDPSMEGGDELLGVIQEAAQSEDNELKSAAIIAISQVIQHPVDGIREVIPIGYELALSFMDWQSVNESVFENDSLEDEDEESRNRIVGDTIHRIISSINFIFIVIKQYPDVISAENVEQLSSILTGLMILPLDSIYTYSAKAMFRLTLQFQLDWSEFIENASCVMESSMKDAIGTFFKIVRRAIQHNVEFSEEILNQMIDNAFKVIKRDTMAQFSFGDEDEAMENYHGSMYGSTYDFLAVMIKKYPTAIDPAVLFDTLKVASKKGSIYERFDIAKTLSSMLTSAPEISAIVTTASMKQIMKAFGETDGTNPPGPIAAFHSLLLARTEIVEKYLGEAIGHLEDLLQIDNEGQAFYRASMTAGVALMCALWRAAGDSFDAETYCPIITSVLPLTMDFEGEADKAVSYLVDLAPHFGDSIPELSLGLIRMVMMRDDELQRLKLSEGAFKKLIAYVRNLGEQSRSELISAGDIEDESAVERLQARIR